MGILEKGPDSSPALAKQLFISDTPAEADARLSAKFKGKPYLTFKEAVASGSIEQTEKGSWRPKENYKWIDSPAKGSRNFATEPVGQTGTETPRKYPEKRKRLAEKSANALAPKVDRKLAVTLRKKGVPKKLWGRIAARFRSEKAEKILAQAHYTAVAIGEKSNEALVQNYSAELAALNERAARGSVCFLVDGQKQILYVVQKIGVGKFRFRKRMSVSTAKKGFGKNKNQTPLGLFTIPVGDFYVVNADFGEKIKRRKPSDDYMEKLGRLPDASSYITTAAFFFKELGRGFAIHGTNNENVLGVPVSDGCIHTSNLEAIELATIIGEQRHRGHGKVFVQILDKPLRNSKAA